AEAATVDSISASDMGNRAMRSRNDERRAQQYHCSRYFAGASRSRGAGWRELRGASSPGIQRLAHSLGLRHAWNGVAMNRYLLNRPDVAEASFNPSPGGANFVGRGLAV